MPAQRLRAPHGDPGERLTVGEVEAAHLEDPVDAERPARRRRRGHEGELEDAAFGGDAGVEELGLDGPEAGERLHERVAGHEPSHALPGVDEADVAQFLQRPADGDAARRVGP